MCRENKTSSDMININITIDTNDTKPVSPYIYGVNISPNAEKFTAGAYRLGGNRTTGYNWENNLSNAGEDWHNFNDEYMVPRGKNGSIPAITVTDFAENVKRAGAYAVITLPMAGYVANDNKRTVTQEETAPSARFAKIINRKNGELSLVPDLNDGVVYSDEFINFLINRFGKAGAGGINGYSLDNEPALWPSTHPRIHPEKPTVDEILEKSISLSSVVKDLDPDAEIFGPALYGVNAYVNFQDAPDWRNNYSKKYLWFIDAYLDGMRKAEEENGRRLLDVLDVHYYTEARCAKDHRVTEDRGNDENCIHTRFQSTRTLWDWSYREKSWVAQSLSRFLPILPALNASIEKYYPGTKLSITEYNFGYESHISGGIAQADTLGIFAEQGVYLAALWPLSDNLEYSLAGINLYTNYDGKGGKFGDTLVKSSTGNIENSSVYASAGKDGTLHIILLNKNQHSAARFSISIQSDTAYKTYTSFGFDASSPEIKLTGSGKMGRENTLVFELASLSACHLVLSRK
ncbi:MAG: glycoside hydrolase family 44 protein [Treponema sp.]|nr:glycoside hydrolase family 44 protein [Treponema sp.]